MSTVHVLFEGLCLWLTTFPGAPAAVVPDFANAVPHHVAKLSIEKSHVVEKQCPPPFDDDGQRCLLPLNGAGGPGGVKIELIPEVPAEAEARSFGIPSIEHDVPLTLRTDYTPLSGAKLAAHAIVTQGGLVAEREAPGDHPIGMKWTMTTKRGGITLRLSNLASGRTVTVPLVSGARVRLRNKRPAQKTTHTDVADWCLYYTMFEQVGCPGPPEPPRADPSDPDGFETIACSNSQYP